MPLPEGVEGIEKPSDLGTDAEAVAERWKQELIAARKGPYATWMRRAKKAVKRYRDEDTSASDDRPSRRNAQFNVLWSNIATTGPAIYAKPPQALAERRYLDKDIEARAAATILQRALAYQVEESGFHDVMMQNRIDYQLVGICFGGWVRYCAEYEKDAVEPGMQFPPQTEKPTPESDQQASEQAMLNQIDERVTAEKLVIDYSHWGDELMSPARYRAEVRWRAKRAPFTRKQLTTAFGKAIGGKVPLKTQDLGKNAPQITEKVQELMGRAEVWQIWDMIERKTIWICEEYDGPPLKQADDLMSLKGFAPAPWPARGTVTNDSVWPIPDYEIYFDQARELDSLTARIAALTRTIKAVGVFDQSIPELQRLMDEGMENKLIGTKNWAKLTQKGGLPGAVSFLPIKEFADALTALYLARTQVKQDLYEISGTSDILRGATNPNETAKAQQLKGQYSGMRLQDRKDEFNRLVKDTLCIMAEVICEWFDADTIWLMSDFEQWAQDQDIRSWAAEKFPAPPQAVPQMGHNGGPPLDAAPAPGAMMPPPAGGPSALPVGQPPMVEPQNAGIVAAAPMGAQGIPGAGTGGESIGAPPPPAPGMAPGPEGPSQEPGAPLPSIPPKQAMRELFNAALKLLRQDKLRSFRIDVETDSTVAQDMEAEKVARTEFITSVTAFLAQAAEMAGTFPQLMPVLGKFLLFGARGFRVGRELESSLESLIADLEKQARNPPPPQPSPEEIKAKAAADQMQMKGQLEQAKMQAQQQADAQTHQMDMTRLQMEMQALQQKLEAELQMMQAKLQFEREKMQMDMQAAQQKMQVDAQMGQQKLAISEAQGQQKMALSAQEGELQSEQMERQAEHDERSMQRDEKHDEVKIGLAEKAAKAKASAASASPAKKAS